MSRRISALIKQRGGWAQMEKRLRAKGTTVTESTMSRLINGETEPKLGTLMAIADALEVELRDLLPVGIVGEAVPTGVPMARWSAGRGLSLVGVGRGLILGSDLLPKGRMLVAMTTGATNMAPAIARGDTLVIDLGQDVADGSTVLIADPSDGRERLMWVQRIDAETIAYTDASGYMMGSPDLIKGRVHLVIRAPRQMPEMLPAPPEGASVPS